MTLDEHYGHLQAAILRLKAYDEWYGMLGKRYGGGGGGYGRFHFAVPNIYFQASDGAKNYHEMPRAFAAEFDVELKSAAAVIAASIREKLVKEVSESESAFGAAALAARRGAKTCGI